MKTEIKGKTKLTERQKRQRRRSLFIFLMLVWPVAHFIFTQVLNLNMFWMAFNDYTLGANHPTFVGFDNFEGVFRLFDKSLVENEWVAVKNSLSMGALVLCINVPLSLAFSYLIYTKVPGNGWLRKVLYLPCITSAVVLVLVFQSFMESGPLRVIYNFLGIADKWPVEGWLGPNTAWTTLLIFSVWTGFSQNMLYFLSSMNRIPEEYIEAAKLDGATEPQIFFKIVLPLISSTVGTMLTLTISSVFSWAMPSMLMMRGNTNGMNNTGTFGLSVLHYTMAKRYGIASAYGILLTLIAIPITLGVRWLTNRWADDTQF